MSRMARTLILIALQAAIAGVALASRYDPPNVRPFFDAGYSGPVEFGEVDNGFGFGAGLELESTRRFSVLFRFEYDVLEGKRLEPGYYGPYEVRQEYASSSWMVAARGYLTRRGLRPYGELAYGIRLSGDRDGYYYVAPREYALRPRNVRHEGMIAAARIGFSTARPWNGGLFFEAGYEGVVHNLDEFAIVPMRVGVVFP